MFGGWGAVAVRGGMDWEIISWDTIWKLEHKDDEDVGPRKSWLSGYTDG